MEVIAPIPLILKNLHSKPNKILHEKLSYLMQERINALERGYNTVHIDDTIAEIREILSERREKKRKKRKCSKDFTEKTKFVICTRDKIKKPLENYHHHKVQSERK